MGKFFLSRSGKFTWNTLVLNQKPTIFSREALNWFSIEFENYFGNVVQNLYTEFNGDISILQKKTRDKKSIDQLIEEVFHLSLRVPHEIGSLRHKKASSELKKLYTLAKQLERKKKEGISLETLIDHAKEKLNLEEGNVIDLIYKLRKKEILKPIFSEKIKALQV
ncbi:MAG: hypothetical protein EU539_03290 [Promethearchaeota archaeon]|nr:MAG: hypothetical protein EU539_03290 [Candidatus Lokiarchaeota archaeon]